MLEWLDNHSRIPDCSISFFNLVILEIKHKDMENEIAILNTIIQRRRSVFPASYTAEEIPDAQIRQVLESANYAPTHKLTEPWRFVVCRKEAKARLGRELARVYKEQTPETHFLQKKYQSIMTKVEQSSCVILLNLQLHPDLVPEWEELAALACAVQNMALTAEALQIGAYWSSPGIMEAVAQVFGLQAGEKCYGLFYMGYHQDQPREAKRTPIADKITWLEE